MFTVMYISSLNTSSGVGASLAAQQSRTHLQFRRRRLDPWVRKIPWRRKWQPTPVILPGKPQRQRLLGGYGPWGRKESDTTERLSHHYHLQWVACPGLCIQGSQFRRAEFIQEVPPALESLLRTHCPLLPTFILQTSTEMLLEASLTLGAGSYWSLAF